MVFFLHRHKTIKHLTQFELEDRYWLCVCIFKECNEMQIIFDWEYNHGFLGYQIQSLSVFCMRNLRDIWVGPSLPLTFFLRIRFLTFPKCPNLTTIIPLTFLSNLVYLEELIIEKCPKVTTLITNSSKLTSGIYLIKLRKVLILYLPKVINISNGFMSGYH